MNNRKLFVHDYETIRNCFLAIFFLPELNRWYTFEMSTYKNNFQEYIRFCNIVNKQNHYMVGYNSIDFDGQITYYCMQNAEYFSTLTGEEIAEKVSEYAGYIIEHKDLNGWPPTPLYKLPFDNIDPFKINNYGNKNKSTSLKWLQYSMDWTSIMDMECDPNDYLTPDEILKLKKYCRNDILSTYEVYLKDIPQVNVRRDLAEHFKLPLHNASEPKLVKEVFLDSLSKTLNIPKKELKNMRTNRKQIHVKDTLLPYYDFKTEVFKNTLKNFSNLVLDANNLKGSFQHECSYRGIDISFALGGIHGAKRGYYVSDEEYVIKSLDVRSYYPNLAIRNKWAPAHLDKTAFCNQYEWYYDERLKYSKKDPLNYLYKIVLNSAFGLSNDESFLKDQDFTMRIK